MNEVKITYETLFDLLRREKDREELQELDQTFYKDVLDYLEQKKSFIKQDDNDVFGVSESEKTKNQIRSIKIIVKDLYEQRQRKIVRMAVNRSKVQTSITNTVAMLPEEKIFFDELLLVFTHNRKNVLNKLLFFENGNGNGVSAQPVQKEEVPEPVETNVEDESEVKEETEEVFEEIKTEDEEQDETYEKIKVKFTGSVPKFVGNKMEVYGPYEDGDEAELPKIIVNILVNKNRVELV